MFLSFPQQPGGRLLAEEQHCQREERGRVVAESRQSPGEGGPAQHADEEAGGVADHGEDTAGSPQVRVGDLAHKYRAGHQVTPGAVPGQKPTCTIQRDIMSLYSVRMSDFNFLT